MARTWEHPELGRLEYDRARDAWTGTVELPAFAAFTFNADEDSPGRCTLYFETPNETDAPSAAAVGLAVKIVSEQRRLVQAITAALWEDFNDRGPDSGMWWRGDLDQVAENGEEEDLPPPTDSEDLLAWMRLDGIIVRSAGTSSQQPAVVELTFAAAFEEEHGVGILTDGAAILGIGYVYDVQPFTST